MNLGSIFFAFCMGVLISIYLPMNSSVGKVVGSSLTASTLFFFVGACASLLIFFFIGDTRSVYRLKHIPYYFYLPGIVAALNILGTTFLIPKVGARRFFILVIAGQILTAMILGHFGALELPKDPITFKKLGGACLVLVGVALST